MAADPNAAPLEQNIKNLECDGVPYRVVKEDPKILHYVSLIFLTREFSNSASHHPETPTRGAWPRLSSQAKRIRRKRN